MFVHSIIDTLHIKENKCSILFRFLHRFLLKYEGRKRDHKLISEKLYVNYMEGLILSLVYLFNWKKYLMWLKLRTRSISRNIIRLCCYWRWSKFPGLHRLGLKPANTHLTSQPTTIQCCAVYFAFKDSSLILYKISVSFFLSTSSSRHSCQCYWCCPTIFPMMSTTFCFVYSFFKNQFHAFHSVP